MKRLVLLLLLSPLFAHSQAKFEIALVDSYPEVRVDGRPFFVHSAAFFYYRTPRHRWEELLRKYREMGINTLDVYIPWNWHEPAEGAVDFTGRTNPRRDVKGLLELAERLGLKVILRPGPVILNEWKHGGYPGWLLARPEYRMPLVDQLEGRYPPMSNLAPRNSEEASAGWLDNPTHMMHARRYLQSVARELIVPHDARQGGAILFVQLDDDQALGRSNYNGPSFWRYMHELRKMLAEGGSGLPVFLNPTDMRVSAAGWDSAFERPIAAMGQWYQPAARPEATDVKPGMPLQPGDFSEIEFFTETLKTQPGFPAMIIEFQAGWYCPADDLHPRSSDPANTLLGARTLFENGLKGINYFPLQDTIYPAGYEVPWTNRHYTWQAALDVNGRETAKAAAIRRNGRLLQGLGPYLAATHKWAGVGLVYPLGAYPQEKLRPPDIQRISGAAIKLQGELRKAGFSAEYLDPQYATPEQSRRYPVLVLPVDETYDLSERAASLLEARLAAGGRLVAYPRPPREPALAGHTGITVADSLADAVAKLAALGARRPVVAEAQLGPGEPPLLFSMQVANRQREGYGYGLLFLTNPDYANARRVKLAVLDPRVPTARRIELPELTVRAKDSVVLPIRLPVCSRPDAWCAEEIVYATAELIGYHRVGNRVQMRFYAPEEAEVRLRVSRSRQGRTMRGDAIQEFAVPVPAGNPPDFLRTLTISLLPGAEVAFPRGGAGPRGVEMRIVNAATYPLGDGPRLPTEPPLVVFKESKGRMTIELTNRERGPAGATLRVAGSEPRILTLRPNEPRTVAFPIENGENELVLETAAGTLTRKIHAVWVPPGRAVAYRYDFDGDGEAELVLENAKLRAVFSPGSGGRALVLENKASGQNLFTTAGAFRDRFSYYQQAPGANPRRLRGAFGLHNRPYEAAITGDGPAARVTLAYSAPDVLPAGARIVKTFTLPGDAGHLLADYEVALVQPSPRQQFISVHSLPPGEFPQGENWAAGVGEGRFSVLVREIGPGGRAALQEREFSGLLNVTFPAMDGERQTLRFRMAWGLGAGGAEEARATARELAVKVKR